LSALASDVEILEPFGTRTDADGGVEGSAHGAQQLEGREGEQTRHHDPHG
jgi:hypothetical protein